MKHWHLQILYHNRAKTAIQNDDKTLWPQSNSRGICILAILYLFHSQQNLSDILIRNWKCFHQIFPVVVPFCTTTPPISRIIHDIYEFELHQHYQRFTYALFLTIAECGCCTYPGENMHSLHFVCITGRFSIPDVLEILMHATRRVCWMHL